MEPLQITVNGQARTEAPARPHTNLLDWLRDQGLTGAKEGCAEGECGACAVLVARADGPEAARWTAINACLPPALAFDGQEVLTAEGLGTAPGACATEDLHPVQREMAERGGSQCGYCTPGFVCSMAAEYYRPERAPRDADDAVASEEHGPNGFDLHALSGNLCRCTGYRPIRDAAYALADPNPDDPLAARQTRPAPAVRHTVAADHGAQFIRPANLADLLQRYADAPDAALVAGATDLGVDVNLRGTRPPLILAIDQMAELRTLTVSPEQIEIGAALTLTEIERTLGEQVPLLAKMLPQFASRLIRNTATLGGNIATASPIGDAAPVLLALDATLVLASLDGERQVRLAEYFTGYRETIRQPGEVIRAIGVPFPLAPDSAFYKVAKRRFDDISSVAVAFAMSIDAGVISAVRIGLGGVAATPIRAEATEAALSGQAWSAQSAREAAALMAAEGTPMDDHRASGRYRAAMLEQSLLRFFAQTTPAQQGEVAR